MDEGDVNCKNVPKKSRKVVKRIREVVNHSPEEIYAMLVECGNDANEASNRLLSQDVFQEVKRKGKKKKQPKNTSDCSSQRIDTHIQDPELMNGSAGDHNGNDRLAEFIIGFGSETSREQIIDNHLAGSSTTSGTLGPNPPSNTEAIAGVGSEMSSKQIINNHGPSTTTCILGSNPPSNSLCRDLTNVEAVPSLRVTSSSTYAWVVKKNLGLSEESVNQAPVKDDCPLDEKPDNLLCDGDYGGSRLLCDEDNNRNDETELQTDSFEHNQTEDPSTSVVTSLQELSIETDDESKALVKEDKPVLILPNELRVNNTSDLSQLRFGGFDREMNGSDFTDCLSPKHLNSRDDGFHEEEVQQINSNQTHEQTQENPVVAPSEPSLEMQSYNTFLETMHLDPPFNQALPTNQINTSESSLGRMPSVSVNQQAVNHHYSQPKVSSGHYGNTMNFPHSQPVQIGGDNYKFYQLPSLDEVMRHINLPPSTDSPGNFGHELNYPHSQPKENAMLPSAFQQNYGRNNNNPYHDQSVASAMLPQYRNSDMPYRNNVPYAAYGSTIGSANSFGLPSDNPANWSFGYDSFFSSQLNRMNHLPSIQHQNVNSNVWHSHQEHNQSRVNSRNDYYRSFPGHQNEQPQSLRRQEPQHPYNREIDYERSRVSHMNQQNSRRDPSNQTQQQPWQRRQL